MLFADQLLGLGFPLQPRQKMERDPDILVALTGNVPPHVLTGIPHLYAPGNIFFLFGVRKRRRVKIIIHQLGRGGNRPRIEASKISPAGKNIHCTEMIIQIHDRTSYAIRIATVFIIKIGKKNPDVRPVAVTCKIPWNYYITVILFW